MLLPLVYRNLQLAVKEAKKLCCVVIDTLGRELMIRRPVSERGSESLLPYWLGSARHVPTPCGVAHVPRAMLPSNLG